MVRPPNATFWLNRLFTMLPVIVFINSDIVETVIEAIYGGVLVICLTMVLSVDYMGTVISRALTEESDN